MLIWRLKAALRRSIEGKLQYPDIPPLPAAEQVCTLAAPCSQDRSLLSTKTGFTLWTICHRLPNSAGPLKMWVLEQCISIDIYLSWLHPAFIISLATVSYQTDSTLHLILLIPNAILLALGILVTFLLITLAIFLILLTFLPFPIALTT